MNCYRGKERVQTTNLSAVIEDFDLGKQWRDVLKEHEPKKFFLRHDGGEQHIEQKKNKAK